jgi:hypothetical protein
MGTTGQGVAVQAIFKSNPGMVLLRLSYGASQSASAEMVCRLAYAAASA